MRLADWSTGTTLNLLRTLRAAIVRRWGARSLSVAASACTLAAGPSEQEQPDGLTHTAAQNVEAAALRIGRPVPDDVAQVLARADLRGDLPATPPAPDDR